MLVCWCETEVERWLDSADVVQCVQSQVINGCWSSELSVGFWDYTSASAVRHCQPRRCWRSYCMPFMMSCLCYFPQKRQQYFFRHYC